MQNQSNLPRCILFLHNYENNGANRFVFDLVKHLATEWVFEVISPYAGVRQADFEKLGFSARVVPYSELEDYFERNADAFDICVVNMLLNAPFIQMIRSYGLPVHLTVHETMPLEQAAEVYSKLWGIPSINYDELARGLATADSVSFPAAETLRTFESYVKKGQGRLIYNGLDAANFDAPVPDRVAGELNLLMMGTISPKKNQLQCLKVLREVKSRRPDIRARLTLVGARDFRPVENQYVSEIRAYEKANGLEGSVEIVPNTPEVSGFYRRADLMIHPALNETFPYVVLEGMYFGLPVLASRIGGIPEQVKDGEQGFLHDPEDTSGFASSVIRLYDDREEYQRISDRARRTIQDRFMIEKMTSAYRTLFSDLYSFRKLKKHAPRYPVPSLPEEVIPQESPAASVVRAGLTSVIYRIGEKLENRSVRPKYYELLMQGGLSHARALELQKRLLHATLLHCKAEIPYYRDLFQKVGFEPDSVLSDLRHLEKIPLLTKELVHENFDRLQAKTRQPAHYRYSNGSTGISRPVLYSTDDLDWTAAVSLYIRQRCGKSPTDPEVHFATPSPHQRTLRSRLQELGKNLALNRKVIFAADVTEETLERTFRELQEARPVLVQAQPSVLYALACHLIGRHPKRDWPRFRIFESTGEVLDPLKAKTIASTFGCHVVNRYGLAEFGVVGLGLHDPFEVELLPTIAHAESVEGEVVLTSLRRHLMPLIRYRTGDLGSVYQEEHRTVIRGLVGRVFESIQLQGKLVSTKQLQDVILSYPDVIDFQVVQSPRETELRLALRQEADAARMREQLSSVFEGAMKVEVRGLHEFIRKGDSAKFRHVVSLGE